MKDMDRRAVGALIASLRRERGWTQKELAEKLYVTDKAVSKWERGLSLPDQVLLLPLAEALGISAAELLRGERAESTVQTEKKKAVARLSREEIQRRRRVWKRRFFLCIAVAAAEIVCLLLLGVPGTQILRDLGLLEGLMVLFGAYFCFGAKEVLPDYYDENKICCYSDGIFRMNFPGICFNNHNWPHILRSCRIWLLTVPVIAPPVYLLAVRILNPWLWMLAAMAMIFSIFIPVAVSGRRYA